MLLGDYVADYYMHAENLRLSRHVYSVFNSIYLTCTSLAFKMLDKR